MTADEYETASRMWCKGVPVKQIALNIGYSPQYLYIIAVHNRDLFPKRYRERGSLGGHTKEELVGFIRDGKMSVSEVAKMTGFTQKSIREWISRVA